jgi:hypothetical protein
MSGEDEAPGKAHEAREAKLAQALRDNLRRRKVDRPTAPVGPPPKADKRS